MLFVSLSGYDTVWDRFCYLTTGPIMKLNQHLYSALSFSEGNSYNTMHKYLLLLML